MQGPLGCLLGFWPSGPKPCRGNYQHVFLKAHLSANFSLYNNVYHSQKGTFSIWKDLLEGGNRYYRTEHINHVQAKFPIKMSNKKYVIYGTNVKPGNCIKK